MEAASDLDLQTTLPLAPSTTFEAVTDLTEIGDGRFAGTVSAEWTIGGRPNGGYLLAMLGRAATWVSPHDHVIAASAHYLTSPEPGAVTVTTDVLRAGRTASQVRARLHQRERECVEALLTVSRLDPTTKPYWAAGAPKASTIAFDDALPLVPRLPTGDRVAIMEQVSVRLDPDTTGFLSGKPSGRGELRGWLMLPGNAPFDPTSLLFAVDGFPPATFDIEFSGWVPTFELTVYVRALPAPGPVRVLQRAQLIDGQRVDETCFIWDQRGRLVAHGTQLAGVRLGDR
jgi:acyl-coenzyme A thioesterase PaaI-like protein